jgi:hypothetical protein
MHIGAACSRFFNVPFLALLLLALLVTFGVGNERLRVGTTAMDLAVSILA